VDELVFVPRARLEHNDRGGRIRAEPVGRD